MTETEYKETRAGPKKLEIPKEWDVRDLGELVSRLTNGISESQSKDDTGFPVTRIETIAQGWVNQDKVGYVDADKSEYSDYRLEEGDVLFSHINSIPHIGKTAQYQGEEELYHGMNLLLIRFDEEEIEQEYGYIYLNSKLARDFWVSNCKQAVNQASLNQGEVESLPVIIPSRGEQRRIAEILSTVDEAIQQTDEIIETSKELKKGLMQDLLTKGIGHDEFKEVKVPMMPQKWTMPEEWEIEFLEDLTTKITDGAHQTPTYVDEGVPFLKVENIQDEEIPWDDVSRIPEEEHEDLIKRCKPEKGDILLSKNGTIGLTRVVDWDREFSHFVSLCLLKPDQEKVDTKYLSEMVGSEICLEQAAIRSKTGTITNLHLTEIKQFSIPVPPLDEQRKIAERLSVVDEKIRQEEEYREKLEELKKGLMQDMLTGKKRVEA